MRINALNDITPRAWMQQNGSDTGRVHIQIGATRISATPAEARQFASELTAAADDADGAPL